MKPLAVFILLALGALLVSQPAPPERVGPRPDGRVLLPNGFTIQPAGRQLKLSTFPMASQISPDGRYLLILQGGYLKPSISVHALPGLAEVSRLEFDDAWLGLAFVPDRSNLFYVSGGSRSCVYEVALSAEGRLVVNRTFPLVAADKRTAADFAGDLAISPDGRLIYAAMLHRNSIMVVNPQSGRVIEEFKTGPRPYRILFHPDGKSFFVTSWSDGALYHHDAANGTRLWRLGLGPGLMDMALAVKKPRLDEGAEFPYAARLFVAAANTNNVYVVGLTESKEARRIETLNLSLTALQPAGMTPSSLHLSSDETRLLAACSDVNAVAVADTSLARSRVLGYVPTGWYPTASRLLPDGALAILNGRGERSFPNPRGPNPSQRAASAHQGISSIEYVGRIQNGSVTLVADWSSNLDGHTRTVQANTPYHDRLLADARVPAESVIPTRPGDSTPIRHVVYIIKENRTYDQVLGDLGLGNGDPALTLFGEKISPNHHKLAREFVLLDNFYVNADVSADGHNWSTAAIAPPYVQRMWPNSYGGRRKLYDYEGGEPAALPPAGYLWSNAAAAGLSMRNYGWWATNISPIPASGPQIQNVRDPLLAKVTCMEFRNFDLDYPDVERAKVFLRELAAFEKKGAFPQLVFLKLPNDHTSGTAPGKVSAVSAVADNDLAFGQVIEALSKSKFWPYMAVFVLEDDAQNGPDHVDSHRSPAYILSPYTRGRGVDSSFYNTTSMLRTMELILGLRPMTMFDAAARPMFAAFTGKADLRPYAHLRPGVPLDERNPQQSATAARSLRLDFSEADRIDDDELNDILWRSIRGTEPPAPVRSWFGR
jgi:DNA-binding beta-propeller fold protein YncE